MILFCVILMIFFSFPSLLFPLPLCTRARAHARTCARAHATLSCARSWLPVQRRAPAHARVLIIVVQSFLSLSLSLFSLPFPSLSLPSAHARTRARAHARTRARAHARTRARPPLVRALLRAHNPPQSPPAKVRYWPHRPVINSVRLTKLPWTPGDVGGSQMGFGWRSVWAFFGLILACFWPIFAHWGWLGAHLDVRRRALLIALD